jgi:hypothetical protein
MLEALVIAACDLLSAPAPEVDNKTAHATEFLTEASRRSVRALHEQRAPFEPEVADPMYEA